MLKMERGAGRTASRNGNVDELDERRRTRGSGASSVRMSQEEFQQFDTDVPFWMRDDDQWSQKKGKKRGNAPLPGQESLFSQSRQDDRRGAQESSPRARFERDYTPRQPPREERPAERETRPPQRTQAQADRASGRERRMEGQLEWDEGASVREFKPSPRRTEPPAGRQEYYRPGMESRREPVQEYRPRPREDARQPAREARAPRAEPGRRTKAWQDTGEFEQIRMDEPNEPARRGARTENRTQRAEPRREQAPRYERNNRHNGLLLLMALLGLLAVAAIAGLKVFEIRSITVAGNTSVSTESIAALSGVSLGDNILKANIAQAKKNIESDALLQVVSVTRVFPDKIAIVVHERVPHGAIAYLGGYVIIDENGTVLDVRDSLPAGQYPLIVGVEIAPSQKGQPIQGVDGVQHQTMVGLLSALYDNHAMQYVSEINMGNGEDIWLLTSEGLEIDLGRTGDFAKKAQWIASSVPELRSHGYTSGVLYITGTGSPVYNADDTGHATNGNGENASTNGSSDGATTGGDAAATGQGGNAA